MIRLIVILLFCTTLSPWLLAQPPANTNLTSSSQFFDGEPLMKVNPNDPSNMVVAWMGVTPQPTFRLSIKTKVTFNGGRTWDVSHLNTLPHFDPDHRSADPVMAWDRTGRLYLGYIDFEPNNDSAVIPLFVSTDQGRNWQQVSTIWQGTEANGRVPVDRPWLRVDNSGASSQGTLYITTMPPAWIAPPKRPYLKVSTDQGQSWSNYRFLDTAGALVGPNIAKPMAAPAVKANGHFVAAYPSYKPSQNLQPQYFLAESADKGNSLTHKSFLTGVDFARQSDTSNFKLGCRLVAHPTDPDKLLFAYIGANQGDNDVFVVYSEDGGQSWSQPVRVNDDPVGNGAAQDLVWASYSPSGEVAVTWRDRRQGSGSGFYQPVDIYGAISKDNGATFDDNIRISDTTAAFDSILLQSGNDFHTNRLIEDTLYTVWGSKVHNKLDIYFARTQVDTSTGTQIHKLTTEHMPWFELAPNPVRQQLTLQPSQRAAKADDVRLLIFNLQGQKVYEKNEPFHAVRDIPVHNWPGGMYQVSLWWDGELLQTKKLQVLP